MSFVLIILSYGSMKDIESTRTWQTEKVQKWTLTRSKVSAVQNNNIQNMIWIHETIGDKQYSNSNLFCTGKIK